MSRTHEPWRNSGWALLVLTLASMLCVGAEESAATPPSSRRVYQCNFEGYEKPPKLKGAKTELLATGGHGGGKAIRLECASKCILDLASVEVEPGREYVISLWMKGKGGGMRVKPVTATGADNSRCANTPEASSGDWKEYSVKFKTDDTMRALALDLRLFGGGDCIFDDITVTVTGSGAEDERPAAAIAGADEVFVEAEAGKLTGDVQIVADTRASAGQCLQWGRAGGSVEIKLKVAGGAYALWQRVFTTDGWRVEANGKWVGNVASFPGEWSWVRTAQPLTLAAGEHTLRYTSSSPGGLLDRVWLSGVCRGGEKARRPEEGESRIAGAALEASATDADKARAETARKALEAAGWQADGRDYEKVSPHAPHLFDFDDAKEMGVPSAAFHISPAGSDETGDGSVEKPWKTFAKAAGSARPGVRIVAAAGSYDERCAIKAGGEAGKYIHFEAERIGAVTMKGFDLVGPAASCTHIKGFRILHAPGAGVALHGCVSRVTVDDCEIANCSGGTIGAAAGCNLVFRRIRGFDNRYGIGLGTKGVSSSQSVLIEDCVFDNNQTGGGESYDKNNTDGVGAESFGHGYVFRRVCCSRAGDAGFDIKAPDTVFDSCVAYKNLHYGFKCWRPCRLTNCIAAWNNWAGLDGAFGDYDHCTIYGNNGAWKVENHPDKPGTMTNCIVVGNQSIDMKAYAAAAGGNNALFDNGKIEGEDRRKDGDISADPQFTDSSSATGNFSLKEGSPAIGAGKARAQGAARTDITGQPRADGGKTDLGAYAAGAKSVVPLITDQDWQKRCNGDPAWKLTRIKPK